jgi:hypothetical protein
MNEGRESRRPRPALGCNVIDDYDRVHKHKNICNCRKKIHTVLHIDCEGVRKSTATAYLRIRVTRIRVSRGLTALPSAHDG